MRHFHLNLNKTLLKSISLILSLNYSFLSFNQATTLDSSFDGDGKVNTNFGTIADGISKMTTQADGKVIVAGYTYYDNFDYNIAVARYNADGSLDNSFGSGGKVIIDIGNKTDHVNEILIQNDGKIILIGNSQNDFVTSLLVVRLNTNGSIDTSFNQTGFINDVFGFNSAQGLCGVFMGSQLMIGGSMYSSNTTYSSLLKINADGTLDTSFDTDGVVTRIGTGPISEIFIQNNKIVAGSTYQSTSNTDIGLFRFNDDGSIDNSFMPPSNILVMDIGNQQNNTLYDLKVCSDGKFIVASHIPDPITGVNFVLIKFNADGTLDSSFGTNGIQINDFSTYSDYSRELWINSDNSFYVAGSSPKQESSGGYFDDFLVVKYNADGTIASDFGNNGSFMVDFFASNDVGTCIQIQNDGKIVIAGSIVNSNFAQEFGLARLGNGQQSSVNSLNYYSNIADIYPNPANTYFNILTNNDQKWSDLIIYDINGTKVLEKKVHETSTDISYLSDGIYIVSYEMYDTRITRKIVIKK